MAYPDDLDSFDDLLSGETLAAAQHSTKHNLVHAAVEALEAKVGVGSETAAAAATGEVLEKQADGTTAWTDVIGTHDADASAHSGTFVPLSGGTLTGDLAFDTENLRLKFEGDGGNQANPPWRLFTKDTSGDPNDQVFYIGWNFFRSGTTTVERDDNTRPSIRWGFEPQWFNTFEWNLDVYNAGEDFSAGNRLFMMTHQWDTNPVQTLFEWHGVTVMRPRYDGVVLALRTNTTVASGGNQTANIFEIRNAANTVKIGMNDDGDADFAGSLSMATDSGETVRIGIDSVATAATILSVMSNRSSGTYTGILSNPKRTGSSTAATNDVFGFIARPRFEPTAAISIRDVVGLQVEPQVETNGTVTSVAGVRAQNATGAGTVTTQYGLYVADLTKGATNWAIFTAGTTKSSFGGDIEMPTVGTGPVIKSPNGTKYRVTVSDAGALSAVAA